MIEFKHVSKLYGDKEALSDLNVTINDGEFLASSDIMVQVKPRPSAF